MNTAPQHQQTRKPAAVIDGDVPKAKSFWSQVRRYLPKYFI